jgi:hypothetical protein
MGGLVAREYMVLFGEESVSKLITIATPHHGLQGKPADFCAVMGADPECEDLKENSLFLRQLEAKAAPNIELYSVRALGCGTEGQDGDGVVTNSSAYWEAAENFVIQGRCTDALGTDLHTAVLDPEHYPGMYELLLELLHLPLDSSA